ncbi:MAG: hypothetical protein E5X65_34720 [Mesorhizobium sp.]|nr:MAG: hypothetical protein E5X65_34720 [Mesorhizobium sp.]
MQEFKVAEERNPTPVDVQTMINRMLLPIVVSERYERSFFDPLKIPGDQYGSTTREGFLFEAGSRADSETVDVAVEYADIPIDIRRGITLDLERELGRKPNASEVVTRYEDYILDRDPTPISVDPAPRAYEAMGPDYIARPLVAPFAIPFHYAGKLLGLAEPEEADAP